MHSKGSLTENVGGDHLKILLTQLTKVSYRLLVQIRQFAGPGFLRTRFSSRRRTAAERTEIQALWTELFASNRSEPNSFQPM